MSLTIREFRMDDYDSAVALWERMEGVEVTDGDSREQIAGYLERNPGLSRVAEANGALVGAVLCGHDGRRGFIYHLGVEPAYRGRGTARALLEQCFAELRAAGIPRAIILVSGTNQMGCEFWRRTGWEELEGVVAMGRDM